MKRFQWAIATLLSVSAPFAYAENTPTFNITQETVVFVAGSDNLTFTLSGPGTTITGYGGIACDLTFCSDMDVYPSVPGVFFNFNGQIFIDNFGTVKFGGQNFDPDTLSLNSILALNGGGAGGANFPICPPGDTGSIEAAALSPASLSGLVGQEAFNLRMPAGGWLCTTFNAVPGGYVFNEGVFVAGTGTSVPEPGTLGLMGSALAGMAGAILRRIRRGGVKPL